MKRGNFTSVLTKKVFVALLCAFLGTGGVWARSKFTITAPEQSGPQERVVFVITRSDTTKMEAVYVRCANGTAVNDYTYTYRFGPESFRTYDVQVLDITSHELLASCERRIDYGDDMKVDLSIITNEVNEEIYLSNGEFASGLPEEKYIDMPYNPKWDWRQEEEDGYYKITDKGYDQRRFTFAMYDMYNKFNFYTWFLEELDITVCATLGFTMHEGEDGYYRPGR